VIPFPSDLDEGIAMQRTTTRRRILVIANETVDGPVLRETIGLRARGAGSELAVIAPALNTRLRHWISDEDEARRRAALRLGSCLSRLAQDGFDATGWVGDADPLQAIADALTLFAADEIVIATQPPHRSNRLERLLVERARARHAIPIRHVVAGETRSPPRPV
jgi:hypothetical protein